MFDSEYLDTERKEREFEDSIAHRYNRDYHEPPIMASHARAFVKYVARHVHSGDRILDLGCASGSLWPHFQKLLPEDVSLVGVDLSPRMLDVARKRFKHGDFREGSFLNIPAESGVFDVVVVSSAFHHIHDRYLPQALSEINRVLDEHGILIGREPLIEGRLTDYGGWFSGAIMNLRHLAYRLSHTREYPEPDPGPDHHAYVAQEFLEEIGRHLTIVDVEFRNPISLFLARSWHPVVVAVAKHLDEQIAHRGGQEVVYSARKNFVVSADVEDCVRKALDENRVSEAELQAFMAHVVAASRLIESRIELEKKMDFLNGDSSTKISDWLNAYQLKNGRRPRLLHIGNIANNAYNNAKILNQVGFDCDVICYDYYHIMGCPEWEDAEFTASRIDHNKPDWTTIDLADFKRPEWFAQGPREICIDYLLARRKGQFNLASRLWVQLGQQNGTCSQQTAPPPVEDLIETTPGRKTFRYQKQRAKRLFSVFLYNQDPHIVVWNKLGQLVTRYGLRGSITSLALAPFALVLYLVLGVIALLLWTGLPFWKLLKIVADDDFPRASWEKFGEWVRRFGPFGFAIGIILAPPIILILRVVGGLAHFVVPRGQLHKPYVFAEQCGSLVRQFAAEFPEREDKLTTQDILPYSGVIDRWRELFDQYDIVQGYSTDGIYPLLAGKRPYFAYEHGTIREIPFQNNGTSRLTALTYRSANGAFITNTDNIAAAKRLGIPADRTYFLPHAFDYRKLHRFAGSRLVRTDRKEVFRIFSPSRQHWVDEDPGWSKGNDRLIRAIPFLANHGVDFTLEMVAWGNDLAASKRLIKHLGIEKHVVWLPQMQKKALWEKYLQSSVVVDQFVVPGISGVSFEALALGCPVITADDGVSNKEFFGVAPPILGCWTTEEIANALISLVNDEPRRRDIGEKSIEWVKTYHSPQRVAEIQATAYRKGLS